VQFVRCAVRLQKSRTQDGGGSGIPSFGCAWGRLSHKKREKWGVPATASLAATYGLRRIFEG
jgi:hypothetical protein